MEKFYSLPGNVALRNRQSNKELFKERSLLAEMGRNWKFNKNSSWTNKATKHEAKPKQADRSFMQQTR